MSIYIYIVSQPAVYLFWEACMNVMLLYLAFLATRNEPSMGMFLIPKRNSNE